MKGVRMKTYKINEIFYSIQGEGGYVGTPMVFVRFSGCNLKCPWCDTNHQKGKKLTSKEIIKAIQKLVPTPGMLLPVCLTGGEPMLQVDRELELNLIGVGYILHLETNGTLGLHHRYGNYRCVTISPKHFFVSTEADVEKVEHIKERPEEQELKIVFDPGNPDLEKIIGTWGEERFTRKYLQPLTAKDGSTNTDEVIEYIKKNPRWSISIQLQKVLNFQ